MLRKMITAIMIITALVFSSLAMAKADAIPVIGTVSYNANKAMPFDIVRLKAKNGDDYFVISEDFGMLQIESDLHLDRPMQLEKQSTGRDDTLDMAHYMAEAVIGGLYNVPREDIHSGSTYIGIPARHPDGVMVMTNVKFIRDGLMWSGRIAVVSKTLDGNEPDMIFIYPYTR